MRAVQNLFMDTPYRPRYKKVSGAEMSCEPPQMADIPPFRKQTPGETTQEFVNALIKHVREHKGEA